MNKSAKAPITAWLLPIGLLMGLVFFLFFYQLGSYSLFDMDEPRYAEAAREMLERGNWITPTFNYDLRFDKPVFFYWLIAIAYKVFGVSEFSARLFSAISASLMVFMVYFVGRTQVSSKFGLFSAIILASCLQMIGLARMSVTDMTLACFMTATTLCLFKVAQSSPRWWVAAGVLSGLAVLTKGPVGIVVPGGILLIYAAMNGQFKKVFWTPWFPLGVALCGVVALPWYWLAYQENGQIFLDALFLHNMTRYNDVVSGHSQPWYFYSLVLLVGFLPWTAFLPAALVYWHKKSKALPGGLLHTQEGAPRLFLFGMVWAMFVFTFFSVAQTKLLTYILPMFPGLALMVGATWFQAVSPGVGTTEPKELPALEKTLRKHLAWSALVLFFVLLVIGVLFTLKMSMFLPREAQHISENPMNILAVAVLVLGTGGAMVLLFRQKLAWALTTQGTTMALLAVVALQGIVPHVNQATQGAMLSYLALAGEAPLVTYEIRRPSLTYYAQKRIPHIPKNDRATLEALVKTHPSVYVITKNSFMDELLAVQPLNSQLHMVSQGKRYSLLKLSTQPAPKALTPLKTP